VNREKHEATLKLKQDESLPADNGNNSMVEYFDEDKNVSVLENEFICEYTTNMHLVRQSGRPRIDVKEACVIANKYLETNSNAVRSQIRRYQGLQPFEEFVKPRVYISKKMLSMEAANSEKSKFKGKEGGTRSLDEITSERNVPRKKRMSMSNLQLDMGTKKAKMNSDEVEGATERIQIEDLLQELKEEKYKSGKLEGRLAKLGVDLETEKLLRKSERKEMDDMKKILTKEREEKEKFLATLRLERAEMMKMKKELEWEKEKTRTNVQAAGAHLLGGLVAAGESDEIRKECVIMREELETRKMKCETQEKIIAGMTKEVAAERERNKFQENIIHTILDQKKTIDSLKDQLSGK